MRSSAPVWRRMRIARRSNYRTCWRISSWGQRCFGIDDHDAESLSRSVAMTKAPTGHLSVVLTTMLAVLAGVMVVVAIAALVDPAPGSMTRISFADDRGRLCISQ